VAAARGDGADRELVLFLAPEPAGSIDHDAVRQALTAALPAYMVPARIFELDQVPTTAAGKTDRRALTTLADRLVADQRTDALAGAPAGYADEVERAIAEIWSTVLTVPVVERDRPVTEYGAHSLNIFAALGQVQQHFGVAVQPVDFFRSPTVATLAALVRAGGAA
jgi:acyl carrier protein